MKLKVTEQGVTIPREFFEGIEEVEVRRENSWIVMTPTQLSTKPRVLGLHLGAIVMSNDFDEPLPDEFWLGTL
ncbi:MAG TPA: toxin-antitoxin (TA) system antitoxin [Cyanobacteria bacterium UBA11369]|nr:toxin-antitoxin (TA) system antitoxin [Cyanobacteria bacterium UBA11371]HBE33298.1 toxin-antitoxin (TA) system antitoxin [Cyanobacteria bacterium UBA11368]HBE49381.1 toxin-antitoxin (TA) system antitoxin [Cyanobacteria bacterium UBA11369]